MPFHSACSGQCEGQFFYHAQELAMEDKYTRLGEWYNEEHRAASSSDPRELKKMYSMCHLTLYSSNFYFNII